jgi:formylglycine-generating enzyme required for sulfatase activity
VKENFTASVAVRRSAEGTAPVYVYPEGMSGYGTYQQVGNVWEWCYDWYDENFYNFQEAALNPRGPSTGSHWVSRGGSWWNDNDSFFRGAYRFRRYPSNRNVSWGFRLARTP